MDTRISMLSELVLVHFMSNKSDFTKHIDRLARLIEQLHAIGTTFEEFPAIEFSVSSIDVEHCSPLVAPLIH